MWYCLMVQSIDAIPTKIKNHYHTVFENHRKSLIQHCEPSYVYILSGQKLLKSAKNGSFWRVFDKLKLAVKQCYQTGQFNRSKIGGKLKNATFWVIFKHCVLEELLS